MDRILPTGDLAIKKVLASEENKDILTGLIEDFFDVVVEDLAIADPYNIAAYREIGKGGEINRLRHTIRDIAATFRTADFVSEVQVQKASFFDERTLLYPMERFCGNYNKTGQMAMDSQGRPLRYSSLRPVYSLNILGYVHFPGDDEALRIFELYDAKRNKRFKKDYLRIAYFELAKDKIETQKQRYWHEYFNTGAASPEAPEYIQKASSIIAFSNLSEEELNMARTLERAQAIYDADMYGSYVEGLAEGEAKGFTKGEAKGFTEGEAKGFTEGEAKKAVEIAKKMLKANAPVETIAEMTGLTREEVEELRSEAPQQ